MPAVAYISLTYVALAASHRRVSRSPTTIAMALSSHYRPAKNYDGTLLYGSCTIRFKAS